MVNQSTQGQEELPIPSFVLRLIEDKLLRIINIRGDAEALDGADADPCIRAEILVPDTFDPGDGEKEQLVYCRPLTHLAPIQST